MGRVNVLTLTCPHCDKQLRVGVEHSGWRTRCPHPDCRRPLTIPMSAEPDDEPDEAVLIAEGPPNPIPVIPRHGPRDADTPPQRRTAALLWALTALLMLATASLALGWAVFKVWRAPAPRTASSREPVPKAVAPDPRPAPPATPPVEPDAPAPAKPVEPPARPDAPPPKRERPRDRAAFVGRWEVAGPRGDSHVTMEFRADGACELSIDAPDVPAQRFAGMWRWEDGRLSLALAGVEGARPSDVRWNGPDEFVATNDGTPVVYRRKK
jgi:hypothetical protein